MRPHLQVNRREKPGSVDFRDGCIALHWFQEKTKDVLYCCRLGVVSPYIKRKKTSNLAKRFRLTALRGNKQVIDVRHMGLRLASNDKTS